MHRCRFPCPQCRRVMTVTGTNLCNYEAGKGLFCVTCSLAAHGNLGQICSPLTSPAARAGRVAAVTDTRVTDTRQQGRYHERHHERGHELSEHDVTGCH